MSSLIKKYKSPSETVLTSRKDVFFSLCKSIIGQQISVAAANSVFLKFKKKCKNKINGAVSPKACANPIIVPDKVPGKAKGTTWWNTDWNLEAPTAKAHFKKTELAAATLICCPIILLHREKQTSFLEVSTVSEGDLYFLIKEHIVLSFADKYFFALFQYDGVLLMSRNR